MTGLTAVGSSVMKSTADFMNVTTLSHIDLITSGACPSSKPNQHKPKECGEKGGGDGEGGREVVMGEGGREGSAVMRGRQ